MTDRSKQISANEAHDMRQLAEKVRVGDLIGLRRGAGQPAEPQYPWEHVEVIAVLPRPPDGAVMVQVRHADGTESLQSLARPWRPFGKAKP